jgi:hypothetical protein
VEEEWGAQVRGDEEWLKREEWRVVECRAREMAEEEREALELVVRLDAPEEGAG